MFQMEVHHPLPTDRNGCRGNLGLVGPCTPVPAMGQTRLERSRLTSLPPKEQPATTYLQMWNGVAAIRRSEVSTI